MRFDLRLVNFFFLTQAVVVVFVPKQTRARFLATTRPSILTNKREKKERKNENEKEWKIQSDRPRKKRHETRPMKHQQKLKQNRCEVLRINKLLFTVIMLQTVYKFWLETIKQSARCDIGLTKKVLVIVQHKPLCVIALVQTQAADYINRMIITTDSSHIHINYCIKQYLGLCWCVNINQQITLSVIAYGASTLGSMCVTCVISYF